MHTAPHFIGQARDEVPGAVISPRQTGEGVFLTVLDHPELGRFQVSDIASSSEQRHEGERRRQAAQQPSSDADPSASSSSPSEAGSAVVRSATETVDGWGLDGSTVVSGVVATLIGAAILVLLGLRGGD